MKKLLLIGLGFTLLIVGCADHRWNNVCNVSYVVKCSSVSAENTCSYDDSAKIYDKWKGKRDCFEDITADACMQMNDIYVENVTTGCICSFERTAILQEDWGDNYCQ